MKTPRLWVAIAYSVVLALAVSGSGLAIAQDTSRPATEKKTEAAPKAPEPAKPETPAKPELPARPQVEISNIRFVAGEYGPAVAPPVFQPGERVIARYEVSKFQTDVDSKSNLSILHVLKSAANAKEVAKNDFDVKTVCAQGPPVILSAKATLPTGTPPGKYCFEIKIVDNLIARTGSAKADFEIGAPKFAAANVRFTADREGKVEIPPVFGLGQRAYLQFNVLGLKVDQNMVRGAISAEAQGPDGLFRKIYKAQLPPVTAEEGNAPPVPVTILVNNSMPGKTQLNMEIHDLGGNATVNLPVTFEVLKSN